MLFNFRGHEARQIVLVPDAEEVGVGFAVEVFGGGVGEDGAEADAGEALDGARWGSVLS